MFPVLFFEVGNRVDRGVGGVGRVDQCVSGLGGRCCKVVVGVPAGCAAAGGKQSLSTQQELLAHKSFSSLKHFVRIFEDLVELGCAAPPELPCLKAFAELDPSALQSPGLEMISSGDLGQRVRFWSSPLFKDFNETRCAALLNMAKTAGTVQTRQDALAALNLAVENMEPEGHPMRVSASWARCLFAPDVSPQVRLGFALGGKEGDRARFAREFSRIEGDDINWEVVEFFADIREVPTCVSYADFEATAKLVVDGGHRKIVVNPVVCSALEVRHDLQSAFPEPESLVLADLLLRATKAKLAAKHWPESHEPLAVPDDHLQAVSKSLSRLSPMKPPQWLTALREKATERKQSQRSDRDEKKEEETAPLIGCEPEPGSAAAAAAPQAGLSADSSARKVHPLRFKAKAKGKANTTKKQSQKEAPLALGDLVRICDMSEKVPERYRGQQGRVVKLQSKQAEVKMIGGANDGISKGIKYGLLTKLPPSEEDSEPSVSGPTKEEDDQCPDDGTNLAALLFSASGDFSE